VEVDETYIGGKPRYKGDNKRGRGTKKQPVLAMVSVRSASTASVRQRLPESRCHGWQNNGGVNNYDGLT